MSLSHDSVKSLLNDRFISAWVNIEDDPAAGTSVRHPAEDQARHMARGLGEHNVQVLVLTPEGKIVNALAGYVGPADLLEELKFSLALLEALQKASRENHPRVLARAHREFADEVAKRTPTAEERFFGTVKAVGPLRAAADHRFMAEHPLLPVGSFTTALMVGNARSAFVSQVSGDPAALDGLLPLLPSAGQGPNPPDLHQRLEQMIRRLDRPAPPRKP